MDRGKPIPGTRGPKSKITQQPPDLFIALGAKQSSSRDIDSKRSVPHTKASSGSLSQPSTSKAGDRKRDAGPSTIQPPSKKMKVPLPGRSAGVPGSSSAVPLERPSPAATGVDPWEILAVDCEPGELYELVMQNLNSGNTDKAVGYILGAIKSFRLQRGYKEPCKILTNTILLICQCKPSIFTNETVMSALVSTMRRDVTIGYKSPNKSNPYLHILFSNLSMHSHGRMRNWPDVFVKLYVEDAVADRVWIDNPYCKPFVDNIITAFNTKQPPKTLLASEAWAPTGRDTSSPLTITSVDDDETLAEHKLAVESWNIKVFPRYTQSQENVEKIVLEAIKEQLTRRQQPETITKNFVRFLSIACGLVEIRFIAASRIETWLHNHKLMKPAQELLAYLCCNCMAKAQRDMEVIAQLSKLRLKNKPLTNFFNNCIKEMIISVPENLHPLLKATVYNELSNARNTNNLYVIATMFQFAPDASADALADICIELLLNKDDYLRSIRALLKEINRVLRYEFNLLMVVHSLLRERKERLNQIRDFEFRERVFLSLADLVCMCMLLCVTPQVRDCASQSKRDVTVLQAFQAQVSNIQCEAVTWLHETALRVYRPSVGDFQHILHKVLLLEQPEHYYKVDSWPGENERGTFLNLISEVPLLQSTLFRILLVGISKEHPVTPNEVIEIADQMIRRSSNLASDCLPPLEMDKTEIIDFIFNLCSYNYPENIGLPIGYVPPNLAISNLYWKSWLMLLILAAHNPTPFGNLAWNKYPMLRMFMEMCITNHFSFPPPTMEGTEDYHSKELQILAIEKQKILEFESHLAAASTKIEITEQTSLLLHQLIELKPEGEARRPPQLVLDQLHNLNKTHRLGHLLCRSRNPDFLLDIMSRQGGMAHMPWLAELVHSSEGALAHLPVQCLCEYLLSTAPTEKLTKHGQLLSHLRAVVNGNDSQTACEVMEYLLRRLTSLHASSRAQAIKGLTLILSPGEDSDHGSASITNTYWLTQYINHFPHLSIVRSILVQFLRQALLIETDPTHVSNYINFLCAQGVDDSYPDLLELILDLASLIVERSSITNYILPGESLQTLQALISIFHIYIQRAREHADESFHWSENQDQVIVTWATGEQCTLQSLIVHASIILLTYGPLKNSAHFEALLDVWFPLNMEHPKAYLVEAPEEVLLVPDWLKLRMIRSNLPRLVDAAVEKLEAPQLVLFIQSFGIPVVSMSKLLQTLDKATLIDPKLVVDSVLDKSYMIQLVEVQNRRGAVGGDTFVKALEMQVPAMDDDDVALVTSSKKQISMSLRKTSERERLEGLESNLEQVFSHGDADRTKSVVYLIKAISSNQQNCHKAFDYLQTLDPQFIASLLNKVNLLPLFRILFAKKNHSESRQLFAAQLLEQIPAKHQSVVATLKEFVKPEAMEVEEPEQPSAEQPVTKKLTQSSAEILGVKLGKLLLEDQTQAEKTGLLVDWLTSIELEVASSEGQKLQMELLFSKQNLPFRPLLLSQVLQRSSWHSLYNIVQYLLSSTEGRCPVSALDFLTALIHSPKLWQGRDKAVPKHYHPEDVLCLGKDQILTLVAYILEEATSKEDDWEKVMESRLPLLLQSIGKNAEAVVSTLMEKSDQNVRSIQLLLMIYMALPYTGQYLKRHNFDQSLVMTLSKTSSSAIDVISHTLLSALTATPRVKDWTRKSQDLDICARKLAATHPNLVLRQLPMLAGSLRGRAQYEWGVLRSRGHLLLFGQVLGLLELLQPVVFQQTEMLCGLLDSYFKLLQFHGHMKDLTVTVNRIVTFLQNWMAKDIENALKYLHQHGNILNDIQLSQPGVRPLLSSVSLPTSDQSNEVLIGAAIPSVPEPLPQHWSQLVTALHSLDNLNALQDLDHITNKKPHLLQNVSQHLFNSLNSHSQAVRSLALLLIIRLLRHNPKMSAEALPVILSCLNSNSSDVVTTVLDKLPEIVASMQEYAKLILVRVFQLGHNSNISNGSISKTIALLSLQSGS